MQRRTFLQGSLAGSAVAGGCRWCGHSEPRQCTGSLAGKRV